MDLNAKEKARELADMVGSLVADENLPLEVMEMAADLLKEDCEEIRQAAVDIAEEERAIRLEHRTGTTLEGKSRGRSIYRKNGTFRKRSLRLHTDF